MYIKFESVSNWNNIKEPFFLPRDKDSNSFKVKLHRCKAYVLTHHIVNVIIRNFYADEGSIFFFSVAEQKFSLLIQTYL